MSDPPIRVMILGLRGFPDVQGGVESHCQELYPRLVKLGIKIDVLCRLPYVDKDLKQWNGVNLYPLWSPSSQGLEAMLHSVVGVLYAAIKRPDILHIHAIGPSIVTPIARILGLKVVVTHHGPDYDREKWSGFAKLVLKSGERLGMKFSNRRIVISKVIQALVNEKYNKGSDLIPNGVVPAKSSGSGQVLKEFSLLQRKYVLLVSRMVPEKRHIDLIRAFKKADLLDWKLVLVGDISIVNAYIRSINNEVGRATNIVLTGFRTGEDLTDLLSAAGMFVLPSSHEGLPIALLEAMSYGLPVIASDIPAHLELELDKRCYFALGNVDELAKNLSTLVIDTDFREQQTLTGKSMVQNRYNWNSVAKQTAIVYQEMMSA